MIIEPLKMADLNDIRVLQPTDWPDIVPSFEFYISSPFCFPIKVIIDKRIVGVGASIVFNNTAWLAHIIVKYDYRNRGIGFKIVNELLNSLQKQKCPLILLIATKLGEPVYIKAGFKVETEYLFFQRENNSKTYPIVNNTIPYSENFKKHLLDLDQEITGEDRSELLNYHLLNARVFIKDNSVAGFYMPGLGEGLIVASDNNTGIELMKLRHISANKTVIPKENKAAIAFYSKVASPKVQQQQGWYWANISHGIRKKFIVE